jgi:AcrR family transcriptional regulator
MDRGRYTPGQTRGDQRRAALLAALDELLKTRPLAEIGIADITRAAGVTRSGFYFYFPTKAAAVAALLADFQEEMQLAAVDWYEGTGGTPLERLRAGYDASIRTWRERASLLVAMLDAIGTDAEVREVWETWTQGFADRVAARIVADRDAGLAHFEADPEALATALLGAALYSMERDVRTIVAGRPPSEALEPALIELWHRALYGAG